MGKYGNPIAYMDVDAGSPLPHDERSFKTPSDVNMPEGYGATQADTERGYLDPEIKQSAKYDLDNYKNRASEPHDYDKDFEDDFNFRMKGRESRGFLSRSPFARER